MNSSPLNAFLDTIEPPDNALYESISTTDLAAYVLSKIVQIDITPTFELMVVAAFRYFPCKFALVGFQQYPDASRVNRTLLQCQPKYRNLMRGSASSQYTLTELGRHRANEVSHMLSAPRPGKRLRTSRPRAAIDRIEAEIRSSSAYEAWANGEAISDYEFYHLLHLLPGSTRDSVRENFRTIAKAARDSSDDNIRRFLDAIESQFGKELSQ